MKEKILNSDEFKGLVRSKNAVSIILTLVELFIYFGFIVLLAYGKEIMTYKVYGPITAGIPIGIGVIVLSWLLTGIYVAWANKSYDEKVTNIKESLGGE
ncbi:MAG: DUF485 domain-containing protein [Thermodesulfovibrio sp.]